MATTEEEKKADTVFKIAQFKMEQVFSKSINGLPAVDRTSTKQFCADVASVAKQTDPAKIQTCKVWIKAHVAPSETRIKTLGEYLVGLSKSIIVDPKAEAGKNRIDVLTVVTDVLAAIKDHAPTGATLQSLAKVLKPHVEELIELATLSATTKDAEKKVTLTINSWAKGQLISPTDYKEYCALAKEGVTVARGGTRYELPDCFGDEANLPWYLLPAAYMLQPMIDNPGHPIQTAHMRAVNLKKKHASEKVQKLLRTYFDNIDLKYLPTGDNPTGETEKYKISVDAMGQLVKEEKATGEKITVCNSYGWSPSFCADIRKNKIPEVILDKREESQKRQEEEKKAKQQQRRPSRFDNSYTPQSRTPQGNPAQYQQTPSSRPPSRSFTQPPQSQPQLPTATYQGGQSFSNNGPQNFGTYAGHQNSSFHAGNTQSNDYNNYGYHNNSYDNRGYGQNSYNNVQDTRGYDHGGYNNHNSFGNQAYSNSGYGSSGYNNQGGYNSGPSQSQGGFRGGYRGGNRGRGGGYRGRGNRRN
ncbi:hypothetical protein DM02DRAFT_692871 [Periconia macrospinosa]|uniref:CID domain-containing protein n=1 Tax=Periconia macrospinosa TaxID=97972 RepID=A0A2V1E1E4_9PLEO|nr:hypothetical protein DM02DRAFT_692871 [Periconia macrospinosa]